MLLEAWTKSKKLYCGESQKMFPYQNVFIAVNSYDGIGFNSIILLNYSIIHSPHRCIFLSNAIEDSVSELVY